MMNIPTSQFPLERILNLFLMMVKYFLGCLTADVLLFFSFTLFAIKVDLERRRT